MEGRYGPKGDENECHHARGEPAAALRSSCFNHVPIVECELAPRCLFVAYFFFAVVVS
jgi:hypothetical protein